MSYRVGGFKISKLQLALLIGAPLTIGFGIYIYRRTRATDDDVTKGRKANLLKEDKNKDNTKDGKKINSELSNEKRSILDEAILFKHEGNECYRKGKFDEAIELYTKAIEKCPSANKTDLAIFYQNRAAAYEMLSKWQKVKEDCTSSLDNNPRYTKAYFRRAKAFEALNDMSECLDDVTATCILEMFQNSTSIMYADRVLKQTGRDDAERGAAHRLPVLPSKNFICTYMRSFVMDPVMVPATPEEKKSAGESPQGFMRAKIALADKNFEDIISACTEEIDSTESEATYKSEALLLRGTFHLLCGSYKESKQDLEAVINNTNADVSLRSSALLKRGSLDIQLGDKDDGLKFFDQAQELQPDNADIYHQRAQVYILLEQLREALQQFETALKLAPNHSMALIQKCYADYRIAMMSSDQVQLSRVMIEFKNTIEKYPKTVECYSLMAQVLCDQQQFAQADQFYEKALKLEPNNASLYVHRGIMMLQWKGDIDAAIKFMTRAIEIDEKCELAYETLGTIEVQRANLDHAVELFEKAIKFAKSHSEMGHLCALRNAAKAQINVTKKLGVDLTAISTLAQSNMLQGAPPEINAN